MPPKFKKWSEEDVSKLKLAYLRGEDIFKAFPDRSREGLLKKVRALGLCPPSGWLTLDQFSTQANVNTDTASRWAKAGKLTTAVFGHRKYFKKDEVHKFKERGSVCPETGEEIIPLNQAARLLGYAEKTLHAKKQCFNHWRYMGETYVHKELFDIIVKEIEEKGFVEWVSINDRSKFPKMDDKRKAHAMRSFYNLVVDAFKKEVEYYKEDFVMDCALIVQYDYPKEFWYSTRTMGTYFSLDRAGIENRHKELAAISKQKPKLYRVFLQPVLHEGITKYEYRAELA